MRGLRCSATCCEPLDCTGCPYLLEETVPEDMVEALGSKLRLSCDLDQMAMDAADMLEADAKTISALIEDRKNWMERYEKLKSLVPLYDYVPPEEGADDDEA